MNITVNSKSVETSASTLKELSEQLGWPEKGVAAAVSNKMIPRSEWLISLLQRGSMFL